MQINVLRQPCQYKRTDIALLLLEKTARHNVVKVLAIHDDYPSGQGRHLENSRMHHPGPFGLISAHINKGTHIQYSF